MSISNKILITGAGGFIGKHVHNFYRNAIGLTRQDLDLSDENAVKDYFEHHYQPDIIIHLASNALPFPSPENIEKMTRDNIVSCQNLLKYCPEGCHFINMSSIVVYGDQDNEMHEGMLVQPTAYYALSKLATEYLIDVYSKKIKGTNLRLSATIGKGLTHGAVMDFRARLKNGDKFWAIGSKPGSCKPYVHVDDVIQAIEIVIKHEAIGTFNVSNNSITIEEVAKACMKSLKIEKEIEWRPEYEWKGDNKKLIVNSNKLKGLGWKPKYTSEEAICSL